MILAIDTGRDKQSAAIINDDGVVLSSREVARGVRGDAIVEIVAEIVQNLERVDSGKSISGIAYANGPGSYTGIRIGAAVALGLSAGWGCRYVAVPSLYSELFCSDARPSVGAHLTVIRANERELYCAAYVVDSSGTARESVPLTTLGDCADAELREGLLARATVDDQEFISRGRLIRCDESCGAIKVARAALALIAAPTLIHWQLESPAELEYGKGVSAKTIAERMVAKAET